VVSGVVFLFNYLIMPEKNPGVNFPLMREGIVTYNDRKVNDPVKYFGAPENSDLGIVKRRSKSRMKTFRHNKVSIAAITKDKQLNP
jgi:hypothetical protein